MHLNEALRPVDALKSWTIALLPCLLLIFNLLESTRAQDASDTCYYLNGAQNGEGLQRCDNSTSGYSTCCPPGWTCWSNGVCQGLNGHVVDYSRYGCTDATWQDPACLNQCPQFQPDGGTGIRPCDGIEDGNRYCCDDGTTGVGSFACCNDESNIFTVGGGGASIIATIPAIVPSSTMSFSSSSIITSSSHVSTSSHITTASSTTASTSMNKVPSPTASGAKLDTSHESQNPLTLGLGIGLGVGLPATAAILGAFYWVSKRSRSEPRPRAELEGMLVGASPGSPEGGQPEGGFFNPKAEKTTYVVGTPNTPPSELAASSREISELG